MSRSKLVSVRIDEELLAEIDDLVGRVEWYTRSSYIEAGLKVMVELAKKGLDRKAVQYYPKYGDVLDSIDFKYHREHK